MDIHTPRTAIREIENRLLDNLCKTYDGLFACFLFLPASIKQHCANTRRYQKLIDTLETLKVVPKADNILEFEAWMKSYLESKGEKVIQTEPKEKGPTYTEN